MILFKTCSYKQEDILKSTSKFMGAPIINNCVSFSGILTGEGFVKCFDLASGIGITILKYVKSGMGISFYCDVPDEKIYTLRVHYYEKKGVRFVIDDKQIQINAPGGIVQLVSHNTIQSAHIPRGKGEGYGVNIVLTEAWIQTVIKHNLATEILNKYFSLKDDTLSFESLDPVYHQYLQNILQLDSLQPMFHLHLEKLIICIVERFFTLLYNKLVICLEQKGLSASEVEILAMAEKKLLENLADPPSVESLAMISCMSVTSFSTKFKQFFGNSVFAHFQNERIKKAHQLLSSGAYSVKETAALLGFHKTSSFINAFKKKYNISPGALVLRNKIMVRL